MIKKLRYLFTLMLLLVASVGWATEVIYKTALFGPNYNSQEITSYTETWTATNGDFTVSLTNFNNNNNGWNYVKCGRKNVASIGTITTSAAVDKAISKVAVTIDAITVSNVNSIKLYTSNDNSTWTEVGSFPKAKGAQTVSLASPTENLYYKIEFDCASGSGNGLVTVSKIEYYYDDNDSALATTTTIQVPADFNANLAVGTTAGQLTATVTADDLAIEGAAVTWNSSNENVATIDANGNVTLVATGSTTITANYAGVENEYKASSATYELTVINKIDYAVLPFEWEGGASADFNNLNGVTTFGLGGDYAVQNAPYQIKFDTTGDYIQVKTDSQPGKVTIGVKMLGGDNSSSISVQGSSDGETFNEIEKLTISGKQNDVLTLETVQNFGINDRYVRLVFTKGSNVGVGPITIAKPTNDPAISAENVEIEYNATSGSIAYEIVNPVDGGSLTAVKTTADADWLILGNVEANAVPFTATVNEEATARTAEVELTYVYDDNTVTKTVTVTQTGNPDAKGTVNNPYTVAEVIELFANNEVPTDEVYVKGIVSEIKSFEVPKYQRVQYYISDDGTTVNQFYVYNGYFIDGADFTDYCQLQIGDEVVVCGKLTTFNTTNEFAQNNKITSFNRPVKISSAKYATYVTPYDVTFESSVTAYSVTEIGDENITLTEIEGAVPAGSAVVVKADEAKTYTATKTESASELTGNLLKAVTSTEGLDSSDGNYYVLANGNNGVGFYPVTSGTIAKGKGYLEVEAGAKFYGFGGDETGINDINVNVNANDAIYSISGQRLQKLQRGINIVNGKKIVVK